MSSQRLIFIVYLLLIAAGITAALLIGLTHR
jgi:hypothetical protein